MNAKENKDELRAKQYLQSLDYSQIEYEPLGNVTPDFLLDNKIAVEVRRLNRNFINSEKLLNIENIEIHLIKDLKKLIESFDFDKYDNSAYIYVQLTKPIEVEEKETVLSKIKDILNSHIKHISESITYNITENFELTLTPTGKKSKVYVYNGCNGDLNWVIHQIQENIQSDIDEKNEKIGHHFHLYDEWWLVLVDSITYGLDDEDFKNLQNIKIDKKRFSKVIILSPKGEFEAFEF